jgi:hypothetical protein
MKRRIITTIIALSLLLGFALWSAEPGKPAAAALQANYPLNPNDFTSLGASPFTSVGTYTIDASRNNANPILTKPDNTTISGAFFTSSGGEIAVFTFDSINIPADVTVNGVRNANSRPIALLSKSSVTVAGMVDVSGAGGECCRGVNDAGYGGVAGPGGGGGGGGGGGVGGIGGLIPMGVGGQGGAGLAPGADGGIPVGETPGNGGDGGAVSAGGGGKGGFDFITQENGGGGAFGGDGGVADNQTSSKGVAYGDLTMKLQGGSGGGGGRGIAFSSGGGGGGGGAIEIGAVNIITITGKVEANGGNGGNNFFVDGGAGAGGGILVHANQVTLACSARLNANGGGGTSGGGGGGGRIHLAASAIQSAVALSTIASVEGGLGGFPQGQDGVVTTSVTPTVGPVAAKLAFSQQPTGTTPNTALSPAVTVEVQDACGARITGSTATVTLALGTNPSGATLGGTTSVAAVDGIATFNNLTVNKPGTGYTLTASSGSLTAATSNAFNISCQTITVNPSTPTLTSGTVGTSYSQTFTQTGGSGATTFSKTAGTLPPGLMLSTAGVLSGTATAAGLYNFTVTATDANGCPGSRAYSVTMNCPTITAILSGGGAICPGASSTVSVNLSGGTAPYTVRLSDGQTKTSSTLPITFTVSALTTYTIQSATDAYGCAASASGSATVRLETTAPTLLLKPNISLWPPNHSYQTVTISQMVQSVSDNCSSLTVNNVVIEKVTSDEPDNAAGDADGNTTNDIMIAANCQSVQLRAERDETKNGRVYVITLRVKDASGNTTKKDFKVNVPIAVNGTAVQGATAQTKTSSCP